MESKRIKLILAMVGAGAVLAMGGLTAVVSENNSAQAPTAVAERADGESSDETTARGVPETSFAVTPITSPPYTIPTGEPQ